MIKCPIGQNFKAAADTVVKEIGHITVGKLREIEIK
jgi:hypothetical protein